MKDYYVSFNIHLTSTGILTEIKPSVLTRLNSVISIQMAIFITPYITIIEALITGVTSGDCKGVFDVPSPLDETTAD